MWKDITGFESAYEISDFGVVRSKDRMCVDSKGRKRFRKGQVLNPDIASNGYYRVTLAKDGKRVQKYLHRLIAEHFIPNTEGKSTQTTASSVETAKRQKRLKLRT